MKHQIAGKKLGRDINSRKALLNNLAGSLFLHGEITTTLAKAKFAKSHVEKLITKAKKNKLGARRQVASLLDKKSGINLLNLIAASFEGRNGGYTKIIKLSPRSGDNAPMAKIMLVDFDKSKLLNSKIKKEKVKKVKGKKTLKMKEIKKEPINKTEKKETKKNAKKK